jgi:hypothetical protein
MEPERISKDELHRIMKLTPTYWARTSVLSDNDVEILVHGMQSAIDDQSVDLFGLRKNTFVSVEELNIILQNRWKSNLPTYYWNNSHFDFMVSFNSRGGPWVARCSFKIEFCFAKDPCDRFEFC